MTLPAIHSTPLSPACPCETDAPTLAPTTLEGGEDCAFQHLTCLDSITDSNREAPREIGDESGDKFYLISAFVPQNFTATVCARTHRINMKLAIFKDYPGSANESAIVQSATPAEKCAEITFEIPEEGSYWLHVEGNGTDEGVFFLDIACANTPVPSFAPTRDLTPCTWDYLTCYDMELGSNFGLSDVVGNPAGGESSHSDAWESSHHPRFACQNAPIHPSPPSPPSNIHTLPKTRSTC